MASRMPKGFKMWLNDIFVLSFGFVDVTMTSANISFLMITIMLTMKAKLML